MNNTDEAIYRILILLTPVLLSILAFVGALSVNWLVKINNSLQEMKVIIAQISQKHDDLKERVDSMEEKIYR